MRPIHLAIAEPCHEDWNTMTGSERRRHCAFCDKHVVALAEMTPEEAEALVRGSKPHSLCLRIEHDDDGTILFRKKAPHTTSSRSMPLLTLAVGASLLAAACDHSTPPSASRDPAKAESTQSTHSIERVNNDSIPLNSAGPFNGPIPSVPTTDKALQAEGQTATGNEEKSGTGTNVRPAKLQNASKPRVTTGCVCAVGDRLCDCL